MLLNRTWVAASLSTTPRAPSCKASTIWRRSMEAVSRMVRTGDSSRAISRRASKPGRRGMARSRRRMSGRSWRARSMVSAPSAASPTTVRPGSVSSRRRRPSRKMGWSSAIRRRTVESCSGIAHLCFLRNGDLQMTALTGYGLDAQFAPQATHPFFDDLGPLAGGVQVLKREPALEPEAAAVILDTKLPFSRLGAKTHQHVMGATVFADVHQGFLHNPRQLAADPRRERDLLQFRDEAGGDAGVTPETLYHVCQVL